MGRCVQNIEKINKSKSKRREKNEENANETELMQRLENEDITEMKKHHKRDKEKEKNMGTKDTEEVDVEKKHAKQSEGVYYEDVNEDGTDKVERQRKKRDKKNKIECNASEKWLEEERVSGVESGKEAKEEKKEKAMRDLKDGDIQKVGEKEEGKVVGAHSENNEVERKKRVREKKRSKDGSEKVLEASKGGHNEDFPERTERKNKKKKKKKKKKKRTREENIEGYVQPNDYGENVSEKHERKKKKEKKYKNNEDYKNDSSATQEDISMKDSVDNDSNRVEQADKGKKNKTKLVDNDSATPNKSNKKMRFSGEDDVFTLPDDSNNIAGVYGEDGLLRGRRFTPEEDVIIKEAVFKYIRENGLGDEGLNMVLNCQKCKLKGCWIKIGSAIPYRPCKAVYNRAQNILRRSEKRKWTQEEYEQIINYQEKHGNRWKALADELGKNYWHVRDAWCRIKLKDMKKGRWSQNEYQKLYDLVNNDLKLKVSKEKKSKHGMLRDNICWGAISDDLSTRANLSCCHKWYRQLTSRMVVEGVWADTDDYRLIGALYSLDATCIEDVDWDDLIENRSGDLCHKRWRQMVSHIGHHRSNSFAEQVELLSKRYCPHLLEAREIWDSKPRVP